MLTFPHRKFKRHEWQVFYRRYRINKRELIQVEIDKAIFGNGYYVVIEPGLFKCIRPHDIIIIDSIEI